MTNETEPLTGVEHFAEAAAILTELSSGIMRPDADGFDYPAPPPGTAARTDMLQRAAVHAQLAQAAAIVHYTPVSNSGFSYYGYGEPR